MKHIIHLSVLLLLFSLSCQAQHHGVIANELVAMSKNLPFTMPAVPVPSFPEHSVAITQHGAVPDGVTLNTKAFAGAIAACAMAGGGTVVVPPGTWLTGPIGLRSNVRLHLERGALVQFSNRIEDFPVIPGLDGTSKRYIVTPPLYAFKATNIGITGEGVFDGAGEVWRYVKKDKLTEREWKDLVSSGGVVSPDGKEWWPSRAALDANGAPKGLDTGSTGPTRDDFVRMREFLRPDLVRLEQCKGVLIDGPTFENSPRYHLHPVQCENLIIRDTKVLTEWYAQNGDGIDLSACRNVFVYQTTVNVGDDGLCLKPGTMGKTQTPGPACENIVITDCIVYHAHGGFVIGSESYGGARNVSVKNCQFIGTDVGIRCKSLRQRGGLIEKIWIDGIQMRAIGTDAVLFDMYYTGNSPDVEANKPQVARHTEPVTDRTPQFRDFVIRNVVCNGAARAVVIHGLPEMPVRNITLENVSVTSNGGVSLVDAEGIQFTRCRIVPRTGPVFAVQESRNISITGGTYPAEVDLYLSVEGEQTSNIRLDGVDTRAAKEAIRLGTNTNANAVTRIP